MTEEIDQIIKVLSADNLAKEKEIDRLKKKLVESNKYNGDLRNEKYNAQQEAAHLKSRVEIIMGEDGRELYAEFPDIWMHSSRWHTQRMCSVKVNPIATHVDIRHNCGCCSDSPIELWPYLEFRGHKIYSDPCGLCVGEANYGDGENPREGWQDLLRGHKLNETIIEQVARWFEKNKPGMGDDDEEE